MVIGLFWLSMAWRRLPASLPGTSPHAGATRVTAAPGSVPVALTGPDGTWTLSVTVTDASGQRVDLVLHRVGAEDLARHVARRQLVEHEHALRRTDVHQARFPLVRRSLEMPLVRAREVR